MKTIQPEVPEQQTEATQKFRNNVIVKKHFSRMIRAQRPSPTLVVHVYVMLC